MTDEEPIFVQLIAACDDAEDSGDHEAYVAAVTELYSWIEKLPHDPA